MLWPPGLRRAAINRVSTSEFIQRPAQRGAFSLPIKTLKWLYLLPIMNFEELAPKLLKNDAMSALSDWPAQLIVPAKATGGLFFSRSQFWENIEKLRKYT